MRDHTDGMQGLWDDLLDVDRIKGGHKTLRTDDLALHLLAEIAAASDVDVHPGDHSQADRDHRVSLWVATS